MRLFGSSPNSRQRRQSQSRTEGNDQEESRRRSFAFMKQTPERQSNSSMRRTREHAKQIAAQLTEQPPIPQCDNTTFPDDPPFAGSHFVNFQPFPVSSTSTPSTPAALSPNNAYNMDVIDPRHSASKPVYQQPRLDAFVQQNQQRSFSGRSSVASDSHSSLNRQERTVNSMPTFPSNSTMQTRNVQSSQSMVSGAAARRRMRSQHLKYSTRSEAGAADYETFDEAPVSPYPIARTGSFKANHLLNYAQTPRGAIAPSHTSARSLNSQRSSNSFSSVDFNPGFSFNAFGLDENEVAQEVDEALHDLVQGSHPDMGFFLEDEFPVQNFDAASRGSTPTSEVDGFTDGFRVTSVKQSPTSSERSSLTSTSEYTADARGVNRFKVQAGFHKSKPTSDTWTNFDHGGLPPVSPGPPRSSPHYARSELGPQLFPAISNPLESFADDTDSDFEAASMIQSEFQTPTSEAGALSDVGARSDIGAASDVGAKSDVALASDVGVTSDTGGALDVGPVPMEVTGKRTKSASQEQAAEQNAEEKELQRVSDLKYAWERRQQKEAEEQAQRLLRRQSTTSPLPRENISILQNKLGKKLLSPEILERKGSRGTTVSALKAIRKEDPPEQIKRAAECVEQRTSFASYRERLKPAHLRTEEKKSYSSSKSDVGGYHLPSSQMNSLLNKFKSPKSFTSQDSYRETRSDVGSTPAFPSSVKPRNTGGVTKHEKPRRQSQSSESSFEFEEDPSLFADTFDEDDISNGEGSFYSDDELELMRQQEEGEFNSSGSSGEPEPKKLTYREQRELELKRQRERKEVEEKAKRQPERDVAALIRRRIAANKVKAVQAEKEREEPTENIASARNRLRKVSSGEVTSPIPSPPSRSKPHFKKSTEFSVDALKKSRLSTSSRPRPHVENSPGFSMNELKEPRPSPPFTSKLHVDKSPEFSMDDLKKTSVADDSSKQSTSVKTEALTIDTEHDWIEPTEFASPNQQAMSIVSTTEVDSSSTIRSSPDPASSNNQKRQPASVMSSERADQSEGARHEPQHAEEKTQGPLPAGQNVVEVESIIATSDSTKNALNALFAKRLPPQRAAPPVTEDDSSALILMKRQQNARKLEEFTLPAPVALPRRDSVPVQSSQTGPSLPVQAIGGRPALKDDPLYTKYFKMRKVGMPMDVVKHAMTRDGVDPSVMDGDPNLPIGGVPLKDDPKYERFFRMLSMGLPMGAVQNAMMRDGLDPSVLDGDPNLPAGATDSDSQELPKEPRPKDTHRRTRLHWETLRQVRATSLWAKIDNDPELVDIDIDEEEFAQLFQAELTPSQTTKKSVGSSGRGQRAAVRVIESKRANNGGIILARLKMTHDDMADAVDRIDENALSAEQMQNIIEYLPTSEERRALEAYMLEGGQDAAEKFDGLCECEKFMVSMMTVKHAKRKVRALLFKLQFDGCIGALEKDASMVESACDELKNSVRLRKLLGIVLSIGNRLNTAGASGKRKAGAFSLNSLLKLSHAKAFDKKTTFLHYVVLIVQRNNEILLNFKDDIPTVLTADKLYWDQCLTDLEEVENQLENLRRIALYQARLAQLYRIKKKKAKSEDDDAESLSDESMTLEDEVELLRSTLIGLFTLSAIKKVSTLRDKVETTKLKFGKLLEYFGEEGKRDMQPHELFGVFTTFCRDFDKAKDQVLAEEKKKKREERKRQASSRAVINVEKVSVEKKSIQAINVEEQMISPPDHPHMNAVRKETLPRRSTKSDVGMEYASFKGASAGETSFEFRTSTPMQQHSSTANGMYESPKDPSIRKSRSSSGSKKDLFREKARRRRRMQQGKEIISSSVSPESQPSKTAMYNEESGPPVTTDSGMSPRSSIRQSRLDEQHRSLAAQSNSVDWPQELPSEPQEV